MNPKSTTRGTSLTTRPQTQASDLSDALKAAQAQAVEAQEQAAEARAQAVEARHSRSDTLVGRSDKCAAECDASPDRYRPLPLCDR